MLVRRKRKKSNKTAKTAKTKAVTPAVPEDYFVRKTGNDSNDGLSASSAFRTIKKAATVAGAGDVVYVGAGVYSDKASVTNDGTLADPIRFEADSSGVKTGDSGDVILQQTESFQIDGDDYIHVSGFKFKGNSEMVSWKNSVGGQLQDCEFGDASSGGGGGKKEKKGKRRAGEVVTVPSSSTRLALTLTIVTFTTSTVAVSRSTDHLRSLRSRIATW